MLSALVITWVGLFVLTTRSQKTGTLEMNEVSLAIRTPKGLAIVVGCSHPGVENILRKLRRGEYSRGSCEDRFATLHSAWRLPPCPHHAGRSGLGSRDIQEKNRRGFTVIKVTKGSP